MYLEGKVALVVDAASSELSWHAAHLLASAGVRLALHDAKEATLLADRVTTLHDSGHEALAILAELEVSTQLDALLERIVATWGGLDLLILPPLKGDAAEILTASVEGLRASLRAFRALLNVQRAAALEMAQRDGGQIITLTDTTQPASYAQAGLDAFSDSLRAEILAYGVTARRLSLAQLGLELLAQPAKPVARLDQKLESVPESQTVPRTVRLRLADKLLPRGEVSATTLVDRSNQDRASEELAERTDLSPST